MCYNLLSAEEELRTLEQRELEISLATKLGIEEARLERKQLKKKKSFGEATVKAAAAEGH